MTKSLIDIAVENGAIKLNFDKHTENSKYAINEAQLQATINAVNADISWNCNDIDITNCKTETMQQFCLDNVKLAPFFASLAHALEPKTVNAQNKE